MKINAKIYKDVLELAKTDAVRYTRPNNTKVQKKAGVKFVDLPVQ